MDFINAAIEANRKVLKLLQDSSLDLKKELQIGAGGDISRVVDIEAEKIFIKYLKDFGQIVSEESGVVGDIDRACRIILDPLDGSENFLSNLPYFGSSVAREENGKVVESIITNFATGDIFIKEKENFIKGSLYNSNFSEIIRNNYATIGIYERAYASSKFICDINRMGLKYRSPGALAISLANAFSYNFVIFEGKVREYDVAAGLHMCSDMEIYKGDNILIVSKDKEIFKELTSLMRGIV